MKEKEESVLVQGVEVRECYLMRFCAFSHEGCAKVKSTAREDGFKEMHSSKGRIRLFRGDGLLQSKDSDCRLSRVMAGGKSFHLSVNGEKVTSSFRRCSRRVRLSVNYCSFPCPVLLIQAGANGNDG